MLDSKILHLALRALQLIFAIIVMGVDGYGKTDPTQTTLLITLLVLISLQQFTRIMATIPSSIPPKGTSPSTLASLTHGAS